MLARDGTATWESSELMERRYLQVDRQRRLGDHVGRHKLQAMAAGPQTLEDLWSHCDVVGDVPSHHRQSGQQRSTGLDGVRHTRACAHNKGEQTEGTRELNLDVPDLREGQDGLWVKCGPHREPTCIHADLNLKWFSKQDAAARSANGQFAGVAGDGAELSGRFLNDNDSPG